VEWNSLQADRPNKTVERKWLQEHRGGSVCLLALCTVQNGVKLTVILEWGVFCSPLALRGPQHIQNGATKTIGAYCQNAILKKRFSSHCCGISICNVLSNYHFHQAIESTITQVLYVMLAHPFNYRTMQLASVDCLTIWRALKDFK